MLHFGMNMPFYLMALYGSIMIVIILILRLLLKYRLPKFVFPVLWSLVLLRFLVPFSISIPLSVPVPVTFLGLGINEEVLTIMVEDRLGLAKPNAEPGTAHDVEDVIFQAAESAEGATAKTAGVETGVNKTTVAGTRVNNTTVAGTAIMEDTVTENIVAYGNSSGLTFTPFAWKNILLVVYILGLLVTAGILGWQKYNYLKKLQNSFLVEHNEAINTILRSMDMGHVLVFTSDGIASPLVCGLLNPRIYLPTQMDFQNTVLLRHVLVHETMHIRHRDNWMKTILLIVLGLNWYNPLVWLMAVCLISDLEAACDAAVIKVCGEDERKEYASSLLAMALSRQRATLLYSAFSKTEVEKRVKNVLRYKRATAFILLFTILFMAGSVVVFAAVGQAPFSEDLTSFCASSSSRWGVKVTLARDIALGEKAQERAEAAVFAVLKMDSTNDPKVIEDRIRTLLAEEFGVEKGAFHIMLQLTLIGEELTEEYAAWGITQAKDGFWMYQEEKIRTYEDKMLGSYQSREEGTVDISVQRDALGEIISISVWRQGDPEFDDRTRKIEDRAGMLDEDEYRWHQNDTETMEGGTHGNTAAKSGNTIGNIIDNTNGNTNGNITDGLNGSYDSYEYYLTKEELISDIEQGYVFKLDTEFTKKVGTESTIYTAPYVSQGSWPFYVHEENTINLEIAFSDLHTKPNKNIFPEGERIIVEVISPDGRSAYHFEKTGDEIKENTSVQEQISVTPGEWKLQVSFAYVCGETPAHLRIAAAYEILSVDDINWLKRERLENPFGR